MKITFLLIFLIFLSTSVYSENITVGLDLALTPHYFIWNYNLIGSETTKGGPEMLNIGGFIDIKYLRIDLSYSQNITPDVWTTKLLYNGPIVSTNADSISTLAISALVKYPLMVIPGFSIWPAAGFEYSTILNESLNGVSFMTNAYLRFNDVYLNFGVGADIKITTNFYIIPLILFGINLTPSPYVDNAAFAQQAGMSYLDFVKSTKSVWSETKLDINIGVGYKF